jgi:hypothetical protein
LPYILRGIKIRRLESEFLDIVPHNVLLDGWSLIFFRNLWKRRRHWYVTFVLAGKGLSLRTSYNCDAESTLERNLNGCRRILIRVAQNDADGIACKIVSEFHYNINAVYYVKRQRRSRELHETYWEISRLPD